MDSVSPLADAQLNRFALLDVTKSGTRPRRFDSDRDERARFFRGAQPPSSMFLKSVACP